MPTEDKDQLIAYDPPKHNLGVYSNLGTHDVLITDGIVSIPSLGTSGSLEQRSPEAITLDTHCILEWNGSVSDIRTLRNYGMAILHAKEEGTNIPTERPAS